MKRFPWSLRDSTWELIGFLAACLSGYVINKLAQRLFELRRAISVLEIAVDAAGGGEAKTTPDEGGEANG